MPAAKKKTPAAKSNPNMTIWDNLATTEPEFAKKFNRRGFKGTAINPAYVMKKLTEEFGPCGTGWRFCLENEKVLYGHFFNEDDRAAVFVVRGHIEYRKGESDGWNRTSSQYGQTELVGENRNGIFTDEEAPKKSVTDCLGKCAATLGLSADIYLGLWDDNKYTNTPDDKPPTTAQTRRKTAKKKTATKKTPTERSGAVDSGAASVLDGCEEWPPEQWGEFLSTVEDARVLADAFDKVREIEHITASPEVYKLVCTAASERARKVMSKGTPEWDHLVSALTQAKREIDAA